MKLLSSFALTIISAFASLGFSSPAQALDFDWGGQFRAESHIIRNYTLDDGQKIPDPTRSNAGGYYISGNGASSANFQTLFMRVKPEVTVNDNVYIKSEWWLGNPVYGFYGNGVPYAADGRNYDTTFSRGSTITAQRFWAEIMTDIGTLQIGRAPLHWGLGIVWNSGDELFDRYPSTGDTIRMAAKFGSFTLTPAYIKYSVGNTVTGACDWGSSASTSCTPLTGTADTRDYSIALKYDNTDEDFEVGVNFIRRLAGSIQDSASGLIIPAQNSTTGAKGFGGAHFNTWDIYFKKHLGKFNFGVEAPIASGEIGGIKYNAFSLVTQTRFKASDTWNVDMDLGQVAGQQTGSSLNPSQITGYYLHPDYRLGLIMNNYQFANFAGVQTENNPNVKGSNLSSPFYNPVTNTQFLTMKVSHKMDKWTLFGKGIYATALKTAQTSQVFFNQWSRNFKTANTNQDKSLGFEFDMGTRFQWDDHVVFGMDLGFFFPGSFYKFSNVASTPNKTSTVIAGNFSVGINF